jgi:NAD(P)H-hydrate epimerase
VEILTGEQMRAADRHAIEVLGIPGLLLMESAGRALAEAIAADVPAAAGGVLVLCGKGNNGGDGLCLARHLLRHGVPAAVILLARRRQLEGDAAVQLRAATGSGVRVEEAADAAAWSRRAPALDTHAVVVDALLGTGTRGGARGLVARVIEDVNARPRLVLAVDLPSGLDADSTRVPGVAIRATRTYTLCRPKLPLVDGEAARLAGAWTTLPIGIPDAAVAAARSHLEWVDADAVRGLLPRRDPDSHKGTYGHLLVVAGSRAKSGAAVLVARGAQGAGAGLVTVATARSAQPLVAVQQAEVMTEPLPETAAGTLAPGAAALVADLLASRTALALGPGLGTGAATRSAILAIARHARRPAVLDADALNALAAGRAGLAAAGATAAPRVLTPHPGEAGRLLREDAARVQADRAGTARRLAAASGAVVVLKGHRTIVADPDGRLSWNASGGPAMASGGSGDVLTGVIAALLARGMGARDAARLGVFAHGDAADRAARDSDEGLTATRLARHLGGALAATRAPRAVRPW